MVDQKNVNINPSQFADDGGLLDMTMEELVGMFLDQEKRRHKISKEDDNELEVVITAKTLPMGLVAILNIASHKLGVSRSVLTRCLSHQIAVWYDSIHGLSELSEKFYDAYQKALDHGHPDLCSRVKKMQYTFGSADESMTSFRSILWVLNKLNGLSLPLGLPAGTLFTVGLCRSVSISSENYADTRSRFIKSEVDKFELSLGERLIEIRGFHDMVDYRLAHFENLKT